MSKRWGWWGPTAVIGVWSMAAIRPILTAATPCTDDFAFHLLRLTQLVHLWQQGVFFSRWAPDMAWGYGLPFFNFYAPLSYYLAAPLALVGGLNWGLKLALAFSLVGAGLAFYRLARDYVSPPAALVAAIAYMYAPYLGYDVYFRGNLAESMAWVFLPLALWSMRRLAHSGARHWLGLAALSYAAVLLTHNVFALIFSPLLAALGAWEIWLARPTRPARRMALAGVALGLGLAVAAFFWLPALLERSQVHSDRLLVPPVFVYWNNFISLAEILAVAPVRPDLINPSPAHSLGLPAVIGAALILPLWPRLSPRLRRPALFFGLMTGVYGVLTLPLSEPIWARLPLVEFIQFPWRLLGPAALCLALGVGLAAEAWRPRLNPLWWAAPLAVSALFWFSPRYCPGLEHPTAATLVEFERATDTIGTTAKGEYVPRSVAQFPAEVATGLASTTGEVRGMLRRGASAEFIHTTPQPATITLNQFAYPGWRAWVDGAPAALGVSRPSGLLTLDLPAGTHTVRLRFGATPLRAAADGVSAAALLLCLGLLFGRPPSLPAQAAQSRRLHWPWLLIGLLLAWLAPRLGAPRLYAGALAGVDQPLSITYADGLRLLGYDLPRTRLTSDDPLEIRLYWMAQQPLTRQYRATLTLRDADGLLWTPKQSEPPRRFRQPFATSDWPVGQYAEDWHTLELLPGTPPGEYELTVTLFDRQTLAPIPLPGQTMPEVVLTDITVSRPRMPAAFAPQFILSPPPGAPALLGYDQDRAEARPGDPFLLTLFWQAGEGNSADLQLELTLLDDRSRPAYSVERPLVSAQFPTRLWQPGDRWRGQHRLRLPAGLDSGVYVWQVRLLSDPAASPIRLTPFVVQAPPRLDSLPPLEHLLDVRLGDLARLRGYTLQASVGQLALMLAWQAQAETTTAYRVFVHLLAPDGQIVAQSDSEPAGWQYPTTAWLPGDFILDAHVLTLPPELPPAGYRLITGLYNPLDGRRLTQPDGRDHVVLQEWQP